MFLWESRQTANCEAFPEKTPGWQLVLLLNLEMWFSINAPPPTSRDDDELHHQLIVIVSSALLVLCQSDSD